MEVVDCYEFFTGSAHLPHHIDWFARTHLEKLAAIGSRVGNRVCVC
jgi:hypothetical protein